MKAFVVALNLSLATAAAGADPAGLRLAEIEMPHHAETTDIAVWYPNGGSGNPTVFGENPVFFGVDVLIGAELAAGRYPIVLLSHGMGGTFRTMSWLASGLAERGAIVVAVNHPNSTWRDFDMRDGVRHWTRVQDMGVALDEVLDSPLYQDHIDASRIMAAGFSFGGWTALSMGGMTGNLGGMVSACRHYGGRMSACDILLSEEVNMQGVDPGLWNASYADARITHVAAIDPGLVWGLEASNVEGLSANTLMVGFGDDADRFLATNFDASGLADLLPEARIERFVPGFHFTAMPLCKPGAEAILREENDDPVCTDPEGADRAAVHAAIIDMIAEQLDLSTED